MRSVALALVIGTAVAACNGGRADEPIASEHPVEAPRAAAAAASVVLAAGDYTCDDPCLMLQTTPLAKLPDAYAGHCGKPLLPHNKDCDLLDYERNCIYAAHGLRFRKKKWAVYLQKPWYKLRPEFRNRELSQLERDNVHELRLQAHSCRANDVHVSTADYGRIQQWFAGYAKGAPALPSVVMSGPDRVSAKELAATLATLALRLEKDTWMAYHDPEAVVKAALATAALRDVIVDLSPKAGRDPDADTEDTGPYLHFVFDGADQLVALLLTDH